MKRNRRALILLLSLIILTFALTACGGGTNVYINFDSNGGSTCQRIVAPKTTTDVTALDLPTPSRDGFTFDGWYIDAQLSQKLDANSYPDGLTESITLYAKWSETSQQPEPQTYTLTVYNGNSILHTYADITEYPTLSQPESTPSGYAFGGWALENATAFDSAYRAANPLSSDLSVYVVWTPIEYSVTYYLNGGDNATSNPSVYTVNSAAFTLSDPTRANYDFTGWFSDSQLSVPAVTTIASGSVGDKVFYAGWLLTDVGTVKYDVTFHNGSTVIGTPQNVSAYTYINLANTATGAIRDGMTFVGWYVDSALETPFDADYRSANPLSSNLDLYGKWNYIQYTVTFVLGRDDVTNSDANALITTYKIDSDTFTVTAPNPCRKFRFDGWFSNPTLTAPANTTINKGSMGDVVFYGKWSEKDRSEYTVTVSIYAGATLIDTQSVAEYSELDFTAISRVGYETPSYFADDALQVAFDSAYTSSHEIEGNFSVYSSWSVITYQISYNTFSGTHRGVTRNNQNRISYTVETPTFTVVNGQGGSYFTFDGWYLDEQLTLAATAADLTVTLGSTGDLNFYAAWNPKSFGISYHLNGKDADSTDVVNPAANVETFVSNASFTFADATREGYEFLGWVINDQSSTDYVKGCTIEPYAYSSKIHLFAGWQKAVYSVTYHNVTEFGAALPSQNPLTFNIDSPSFTVIDPLNTDKLTFIGWYADEAFTTAKSATVQSGTTGNQHFWAKWGCDIYDIEYEGIADTYFPNKINNYTYITPTFTLGTPQRNGYEFAGWTMASNPNFNGTVNQFSSGSIRVIANWTVEDFDITYVLDGGTNSAQNPATYKITSDMITLQPATNKQYFTFDCWEIERENNVFEEIEYILSGQYGDKTLYARWKPVEFSIEYVLNGGTAQGNNPTSYNFATPSFEIVSPSRNYYEFERWCTDSACNVGVSSTVTVGSHGNLKLYADWKPIEYTITYHLEGGTNNPGNPSTYNVEDADFALLPASKTGFEVIGWYYDSSKNRYVTGNTIDTSLCESIDLYVSWAKVYVSPSLTYTLQGSNEVLNNLFITQYVGAFKTINFSVAWQSSLDGIPFNVKWRMSVDGNETVVSTTKAFSYTPSASDVGKSISLYVEVSDPTNVYGSSNTSSITITVYDV